MTPPRRPSEPTPTGACERRTLLRVLGAAGLASGVGCSWSGQQPAGCLTRVAGDPPRTYCIVQSGNVRINGGAKLQVGQAQLYNVDDNSAVVLTRDDKGLYAMSAICTHMCCLLTLCNDERCSQPRTNPGDCQASTTTEPSATGLALICPCHGSSFRLDGTVLNGPVTPTIGATIPLPHYALTIDGDDAVVAIGQMVAMETRV